MAPSPESKSPTREARRPAGASAASRGAVCHSASGAGIREASSPTKEEDVRGHPGPSARAVVVV